MNPQKLCNHLGYHFTDIKRLELALTHRSYGSPHNERLEFLGDSLLNFVIAELLYERFDKIPEGVLSRLRSSLVKGETLSAIARELAIGDYLILGQGELKSGGFRRESILADTIEAIIGAIYLDGGLARCQETIKHWFASRIAHLEPSLEKDAKTRLQEHLQQDKRPLPIYTVIRIVGDAHEQQFEVSCHVEGLPQDTAGTANNRRRAEQIAAEKALMFFMSKSS